MLVVLGLDSWDARRYQQYPTPTIESLEEQKELAPFENLAAGELITQVLWPAMLIGENPKTLWPEYFEQVPGYKSTIDSGDDRTSGVETLAARLLPDSVKPVVGRIAMKLGLYERHKINFDKHSAGARMLHERPSLWSAATDPVLISLPGINEDQRNYELNAMMDRPADGTNVSDNVLNVTASEFQQRAFELDAAKLSQTLHATTRGHDLVFSHFAGLDFMQHMFADSDIVMRQWYRHYDAITEQVLAELDPDEDTLVVVSDHGMEDSGLHSHRAFVGSTKPLWGERGVEMENFRDVLEDELQNHKTTDASKTVNMDMSQETRDHLKELGYID
ncbi:alkaline phosphatase family protein [Halovivax limisalsi]|uniref:alkaline phosphatase family protein n=1 Tax=Halovivax limisalsi TaxID=1453760 RepID=UPI001FFD0874|nr:alkaline phosphatase family protein [Halovivax limisalsi]